MEVLSSLLSVLSDADWHKNPFSSIYGTIMYYMQQCSLLTNKQTHMVKIRWRFSTKYKIDFITFLHKEGLCVWAENASGLNFFSVEFLQH